MAALDLNKTVYENAMAIPEFLNVTDTLGLEHLSECLVTKEGPKIINIKQLAENHDIPLENVIKAFEAKGIEVVGK